MTSARPTEPRTFNLTTGFETLGSGRRLVLNLTDVPNGRLGYRVKHG